MGGVAHARGAARAVVVLHVADAPAGTILTYPAPSSFEVTHRTELTFDR